MAVSVKTIVTRDVTPHSFADRPYYFKCMMRKFSNISNRKLGCVLNSGYYFLSVCKSRFPQRTSALTTTVVYFTKSEMFLLANIFFPETPLLKVGGTFN